jgi:hypothetical protein
LPGTGPSPGVAQTAAAAAAFIAAGALSGRRRYLTAIAGITALPLGPAQRPDVIKD